MQAPIFGAGINSGGGFAAFSGAAATPSKDDAGGEETHEEEECKAEFAPLVQLEEVEKTTGEENEDLILELCAFKLSVRFPVSSSRDAVAAGSTGGGNVVWRH